MTYKIAYDAGHGGNGSTKGKRTPSGEYEWNFNDVMASAFANEIKKYKGVSLLRTDDASGKTDIPLSTRTNRANSWDADIYISFHHNGNEGKWDTHTGVETYYSNGSSKGKALAQAVHPALVKGYGLRDRGLKTSNLHITRETKMPAILLEGGFMDSTIDIKKMRNNAVLRNTGVLIAQAVAKYAGLKKSSGSTSSGSSNNSSSGSSSSSNMYRVRKSWVNINSQIGAFANKQNAIDLTKGKTGYKVYDKNGKQVYPEVKSPSKTKEVYRVRKSSSDAKSQIGAFSNLDNAKELADKNKGYKVYDSKGKLKYTPKSTSKPSTSSSTSKVSDVQKWVGTQGYKTTVDNAYGKNTKKALVKVLQNEINKQYSKKLVVDGIVGSKTISAFPLIQKGYKGNITRVVQSLLICKGYKLILDGHFGSNTLKAVKDFQKDNKLSSDGYVGDKTWSSLLK